MRGYVIKVTDIATKNHSHVPEGTKQDYYIIKGGYVISTNHDWLSQDDLYKSKSSAKKAATQYKSDNTSENSEYTSFYDIVEID